MPVSSVTEHWIKQDAIIINLNHFGDPDYLQVSVLAGAVVMAFKQDVIAYNAARNYRTWPLQAANTFFETTDALNVYARLTRSEVNASALIIYDPLLRDIEGRSISYADDGSEVLGEADEEYYYIYLGQISSSINTDGNEIEREWSVDFRFGNLDTSEQNNFSGLLLEKMFKPHYDDKTNPNKLTSIEALAGLWTEQFLSAKGMNSGGGSDEPTVGATTLGGLRNVAADADRTYDVAKMLVLEAKSNLWTLKNLSDLVGGLDEAELEQYLTNNEYAKKSDIPSLSGYATEQWVLGKGYATTSDLDNRIDALVNGAPQAYDTLKEIADVLAGNVNSISDILTALGNKADKATTLSGYGITDAYTKTQVDSALGGYLPLSGGTIRGSLIINAAINATYIQHQVNGVVKAELGYHHAYGVFIKNETSNKFFYITDNGNAIFDGTLRGNDQLALNTISINRNPQTGDIISSSLSALKVESYADYVGFNVYNGSGNVTNSLTLHNNGSVKVTKLVIGNGTIEWDEANKGFKVTGLYSTTYLSAKGANTNGGSTPSGNQYTRLDTWDGYTSAMDGWVLSAKLGKGLYDTQNSLISRVGALEGKATNVSFTQSLTSGTQIGTITIDGAAKNIYAPTIPTNLSQFTNDLGLGTFAYKSSLAFADLTNKPITIGGYGITDGVIAGAIDSADSILTWAQSNSSYIGSINIGVWYNIISVRHRNNHSDGVSYGMLLYSQLTGNGALKYRQQTSGNWQDERTILDNISFNDYTYSKSQIDTKLGGYLPLSGGTITGNSLKIGAPTNYNSSYLQIFNNTNDVVDYGTHIRHYNNGVYKGLLIYPSGLFYSDNGTDYSLIHSGNIGSQSVASANRLFRSDEYNISDSLQYLELYGQNSYGDAPTNDYYFVIKMGHGNADTYYNRALAFSFWNDDIYTRSKRDGVGYDWKKLAFVTDNVASATKLQTSRTIWGQSFDGTGDVSGSLVGADFVRSTETATDGYFIGLSKHGAPPFEGLLLYTYGYTPMTFYTHGSERMRITSDGNVLIGTTTDSGYKLDVNGTFRASGTVTLGGVQDLNIPQIQFSQGEYFDFRSNLVLHSSSGNWNIFSETASNVLFRVNKNGSVLLGGRTNDDNFSVLQINTASTKNAIALYDTARPETSIMYTGNDGYTWIVGKGVASTGDAFGVYRSGLKFLITSSGYVGVNTSNPICHLDVNGAIHSTTGIWSDGYVSAKGQNTSSDMRLKNVLNDVVLKVSDIANAPSIRFAWKNGGGIDVGSSAQYWQGVLPDAVKGRDELEMQYGNIALLSAIAIAKRSENHEERIKRLEKENIELKQRIVILEGGSYA